MPRPTLPPTPASSGDILGREGQPLSSSLEQSFALPPPAIVSKPKPEPDARDARPPRAPTSVQAPDTPRSPLGAVAGAGTARRPSCGARSASNKDDFTLPPPPTRSRKIIQMKPRSQKAAAASASAAAGARSSATTTTTTTTAAASSSTAAATGTSKGKQPSATSAAGRKVARKTAHSLIERRRRSKMNEEFGVLKQMIPACRDQEMHKLAILQASIEYLRYLECCIAELEANNSNNARAASPTASAHSHDSRSTDERDQPMEDLPPLSASAPGSTQDEAAPPPPPDPTMSQLCSPALAAHVTYSPTAAASWTTSPALAPIGHAEPSPATSMSPAMPPGWPGGRDLDHEVTEALLLLNSDRRRSMTRGMSVKDLLTS